MPRPFTIQSLDDVQTAMTTKWLSNPSAWKHDPVLLENDKRGCLAIYTQNHWKLVPSTWNRLHNWLKPLLDKGIMQCPNPSESEGLLHFTFHQCSQFQNTHQQNIDLNKLKSEFHDFMSSVAGLEIVFRGLCVTPTGIALRGFPIDDIQCRRLMEKRNNLKEFFDQQKIPFEAPQINDICHATLFRWTAPPSEKDIRQIQETLHTWNEAIIANQCASSWYLGFGTQKMTFPQRIDLIKVNTPLFVSHRGLQEGPSEKLENQPEGLQECIQKGIHAECDIWFVNHTLYLGHDSPTTRIRFQDICSPYLWLHAKNKEALEYLLEKRNKEGYNIRIFWHTDEDQIFSTDLDCIVFPGKPLLRDSVFMMPESTRFPESAQSAHIVCSDYARFVS